MCEQVSFQYSEKNKKRVINLGVMQVQKLLKDVQIIVTLKERVQRQYG